MENGQEQREQPGYEPEEIENDTRITDADLDIELPPEAWERLLPDGPWEDGATVADERAAEAWEAEEMLQLGMLDGADEDLLELLGNRELREILDDADLLGFLMDQDTE